MADLGCLYTLTTPGGTVVFNNGDIGTSTDLYWIQTLNGLDDADVRAPIDNAPQNDGGLVHGFWDTALHIGFEGVLLPQSVPWGSDQCPAVLNGMTSALRTALRSIRRVDGTLSFTPAGESPVSLTVRREVKLDTQPAENYHIRTFTFGLVAADPSPAF